MATYDVYVSTEPGRLTVEADEVRVKTVTFMGERQTLPAYEFVKDDAVALVVSFDALVVYRLRTEVTS